MASFDPLGDETWTFTIHFSRNWDGGRQEEGTVKQCVEEVFPKAEIISARNSKYPIWTKLECNKMAGQPTSLTVWEGDQKLLFSKYADNRRHTMNLIINALRKLKIGGKL